MKKVFLALLVLCVFESFGQSFYDLQTIQTIKIYFAASNWDYRMDTARTGADGYLLADSVEVNSKTFKNCGVKYKGNSSYAPTQAKNPLHIKLDFDKAKDYQGYTSIKLGNCWSDASYLREPLGYAILRQYMDAPLGNFAKVWINGVYYGLMNNAQSVEDKFLLDHFYSSKFTAIKCNPQQIGGNGSNLGFAGTSAASYSSKYELQSGSGWTDLIGLCDTLNNKFGAFDQLGDVDRFIWMLAFNNATVNLDSYTGAFRQNYYLYQNHQRQWSPVVWDLNMSFGGFPMSGGSGAPLTPTTMQTMSYTLHKTESGWPLIFKLLGDSFYSKMYFAHLRTINDENFVSGQFKPLAEQMHALIDPEVVADPNGLTTYASFQTALTANSGTGMFASPGLFPLMDARATYLKNVLSAAPPGISNVAVAGGDQFGQTATVSATVANATAVFLGFRYKKSDRFRRVAMLDDGAHGDGAAGDGVFGAEMPLLSGRVDYYLYAENAATGAFSPVRAEHEFYDFRPKIDAAAFGEVVLNELTANNTDGLENEEGKSADWIELYNRTDKTLGIGHLFLSDDPTDLGRWGFGKTAIIAPKERLLVWADGLDKLILEHHANFSLSKMGETIFLSDSTTVFDNVAFGLQAENRALARCPDGSGAFAETVVRTPRTTNACISRSSEADAAGLLLEILPNPTADRLEISCSKSYEKALFYAADGRLLATSAEKRIDATAFPTGVFWVKVIFADGSFAMRRAIKI